MNSRQNHILTVLSSIAVGTIGFCVTLPLAILIGAILLGLLGLMEGDGFLPPEFAALFLISTLVGLIVAVFVGIKYYRYMDGRRN